MERIHLQLPIERRADLHVKIMKDNSFTDPEHVNQFYWLFNLKLFREDYFNNDAAFQMFCIDRKTLKRSFEDDWVLKFSFRLLIVQ
jgi:hypothetical protein